MLDVHSDQLCTVIFSPRQQQAVLTIFILIAPLKSAGHCQFLIVSSSVSVPGGDHEKESTRYSEDGRNGRSRNVDSSPVATPAPHTVRTCSRTAIPRSRSPSPRSPAAEPVAQAFYRSFADSAGDPSQNGFYYEHRSEERR